MIASVVFLLLAVVQQPQRPTLLVDVQLVGVESRVMEAVLAQDSTLLLPTDELGALLGVSLPRAGPWTALTALRAAFPSLRVTVSLRALVVYVEDDLEVLAATRNVREKQRRIAQRAPPIYPTGPSFALSVDDRGASVGEASYSLRGRVFAQVRSGSLWYRPASVPPGTTSWALSVIPTSALFLAVSDGDHQLPQATGRLTVGPAWLSAMWTPEQYAVDGLVTVGRLSLFASSRNSYAVTLRAPVAVQIGRTGRTTTARVSVGPVFPSPFSPPTVP